MDCNKDEAAKAKKLAEEKMMAGDFVGAHKFVTKAQRLFPDLENILQMIAVCDVHSAADNKINGLDNWYGILQVQSLADADTIKKQYRKLALLLHPDKNNFAGSEAAFKLIGEAYRWLSDVIKRSQYDVRYKSHSLLARRNSNSNLGPHLSAANNAAENTENVYTFWTCCKNCGRRYKYLIRYMNTKMYCSACKKSYIACDVGVEGVPPSSSTAGKKEFQDQGMFNNNTSRHNASVGAESGSTAAEMDMNGTVRGKVNKNNQVKQKKGAAGNKKHKKDEGCIESGAGNKKQEKDEGCIESGTGNKKQKKDEVCIESGAGKKKHKKDEGCIESGTGNKKQKKDEGCIESGTGNKKHKKDEGCIESGAGVGKPLKAETGAEIPEGVVLKPQPETSTTKSGPGLSTLKKNQATKKRRKAVEESSKSFEVDGSNVAGAKTDTQEHNKRRSSRKKPQVSCTERGSVYDFVCPPTKKTKSGSEFESASDKKQSAKDKKSHELADSGVSLASSHAFKGKSTESAKPGSEFEPASDKMQTSEEKKSHELADSGVSPASSNAYKGKSTESANSRNEDILLAKNKESEGCDGNGKDAAANAGNEDILSAKNKESNGKDAAFSSKIDKVENGYKANEKATLDLPNPQFNVFEDERKTENFAVSQVWSIRDSKDDMPRKYVRVKKVLNAEFKLRITYLEPVEDKNDIPIACGKFKKGKTEDVEDRSIFSGQIHHSSCNKIVSIYPRKGEIWAIFRDWNEEWNTDPEKHKLPYKYDFVEVVNDFSDKYGVGVAYLGKLKEALNIFHWEPQRGVCQIQFSPEQILRFSHKIPAIKRKGIPDNSFELDPAALPKDIFQVDLEIDSEILKGKANGSNPEAPKVDVVDLEIDSEIFKGKADGSNPEAPKVDVLTSPRKRRKSDDDNGVCSDLGKGKGGTSRENGLKLRKSPRFRTIPSQQSNEKEIAKQGNKMNTTEKADGNLMTDSRIRKSPNGIDQPAESQETESSKKSSLSKQNGFDGSTNESPETPRRNAFDFKNQRSEDKFKVDEIWATYSSDKGMPTEYVKIKTIKTDPKFILLVNHMELDQPSTQPMSRPITCGDFNFKPGRAKILPQDRFSHQVTPIHKDKKIVKIYPRKGEIWALYKNCDNTNEEYDIVQVLEEYSEGEEESAKAVALTAKGTNSLYVIERKHIIDIPKAEISRFSHQVLAVEHKKRNTRLVEGSCWELDPAAIPRATIVID